MATGALDSNGIWQYGEDDSETTFSALLNKLGSSTSTQVGSLKNVGRVIQQIQITQNVDQSVTSGAGIVNYTGVSVAITPKFATSTIQVEFFLPRALSSNSGWVVTYLALNGTVVKSVDLYNGVGGSAITGGSIFYALTAGDLSTKTFNAKLSIQVGTLTASLGTLIVREIAA